MKKLLTFLIGMALALVVASAAESTSFERMDYNPPPNLALQQSSINPIAAMTAEISFKAVGADVAVVFSNTQAIPASVPGAGYEIFQNYERYMDAEILPHRHFRPSVTITNNTEDNMILRTDSIAIGIAIFPSYLRSFTSAC